MNQINHEFRDQLLKTEPATPALKERYEKELQAMFQKKVTGFRRWIWMGCAIIGVTFAIGFGTLAIMVPKEFPIYARLTFALGVPFGIGFAILGIKVFRRGSIDLKIDTQIYYGMSWGMPVMITTLALVGAPQNIIGLRMIVSCLAFLVGGAVFLLRGVIEQNELKTREKLLEIEYRLAELTVALTPEKPLPATPRE